MALKRLTVSKCLPSPFLLLVGTEFSIFHFSDDCRHKIHIQVKDNVLYRIIVVTMIYKQKNMMQQNTLEEISFLPFYI